MSSNNEASTPTDAKPLVTTKITVGLTTRSVKARDALMARTGLNQTDLVNRALQIYDYVDTLTDDEGNLRIIDANDRQMMVKFL